MKTAVILVLVCLLAAHTLAKSTKRNLKERKNNEKDLEDTKLQDDLEDGETEGGTENKKDGEFKGFILKLEKPEAPVPLVNPCQKKRCGLGKECDLDEDNNPVCICIRKCPPEQEERAKVCSIQNVTFASECDLYRQKCMCHRKGKEGCEDPSYKHAHMDYFGPCKEIKTCTEEEMEEYPLRMRDWFYRVMEELDRRQDLKGEAHRMAKEASRHPKKWVIPVIWKFCDLDTTKDRQISAKELLPISAPLKPLEHCTGPFLTKCDKDKSGDVNLEEWGICLGLDQEEIEDRCDALRNED